MLLLLFMLRVRNSMRILYFVLILSYTSLFSASIRTQVSLLEASENIRLHSQEIVKNYLYYYDNPAKKSQKDLIQNSIYKLDEQFRLIARSTKDEDSKDILTFLDYSKEKIEEVLKDPFNKDNPALMLDYSEVLLEGAQMISMNLNYVPSNEEKMLIKMKNISFLIERMTKYYFATIIEEDNTVYKEMLEEGIVDMDKDLVYISKYKYQNQNINDLKLLKRNWAVLKSFFESGKELKLPNIISLSSVEVRANAQTLENYHSKNQ